MLSAAPFLLPDIITAQVITAVVQCCGVFASFRVCYVFLELSGRNRDREDFFFPTAVTVITRPALPRHAARYPLSHKGEEVTSEISNLGFINNIIIIVIIIYSPLRGPEHLLLH